MSKDNPPGDVGACIDRTSFIIDLDVKTHEVLDWELRHLKSGES